MRIDENVISRPLADLGYKRVKRYVYRALWSSEDVEHFLYFSTWGAPKDYLTTYFGLRNPRAELFGVRSILAYGGHLYRLMRRDAGTDCCMKFSLGMLAGWQPRASIYLPATSGPQIAATITKSVRGPLFPLVERGDDDRSTPVTAAKRYRTFHLGAHKRCDPGGPDRGLGEATRHVL
jgi:hypothetical protein